MLKITVNGQILDLEPQMALSIEQFSPLFQEEIAAESYSYPIDIPASDRNKNILGFLDMPESATTFEDVDCELSIDNETRRGTLSVLKANEKRYTCSIFTGLWRQDVMEMTLPQLDLGGVRVVGDMFDHAQTTITGTADTFDYVFFPFHNPNFYNSGPLKYIINDGYFAAGVWNFQRNSDDFPDVNSLVPFVYAQYILKRISLTFNLALSGNYFNDDELKTLVVDGNFALDKFEEHVITVDGNDFNVTVNVCQDRLNLANHVPPISVRQFLQALAYITNSAITIKDGALNINLRKDIAAVTEEEDWTSIAEPYPSVEPVFKTDEKGYEFSMQPDSADKMYEDLSTTNALMSDTIGNDYLYVDDLPNPGAKGETHFVRHIHTWWRDLYGNNQWVQTDWFGYNPNLKTASAKLKNIPIQADTAMMIKYYANEHAFGVYPELENKDIMPMVKRLGNSAEGASGNAFGLRFLFYRGMQPNAIPEWDYPLGSSNVYNALSEKIGNYALTLGGEFGIYNSFYKSWVERLLNGKAVAYIVGLTPQQLTKLNLFTRKRVGNISFFIQQISFTVDQQGHKKALVRGVKL